MRSSYRSAVIALAKPYIKRELPGWGHVYRNLVGSFEKDWIWRGERERWVRGKLHGYQMSVRIEGWSNRQTFFFERFYDLPTQLLLMAQLKSGDVFVDAGANEGMITLLGAKLVGDRGKVISFEPNPVPATILKRNLARNGISNVELHECGLGEQSGEMPLHVPHINTGEGSFTPPIEESVGQYLACPVRTGDDLVAERDPRLIKIDVEGFEFHVLRGLAKTIERASPIISMEMVERHLARDGQTPKNLCAWLQERGYAGRRLGLTGRSTLVMEPLPAEWIDGDYIFEHPKNLLRP